MTSHSPEDTARDTQRDNEGSGLCNVPPPGMHPNLVDTVGAVYHKCRLTPGHEGLHVNNEGMTWRPVPADHGTDRADEEGS